MVPPITIHQSDSAYIKSVFFGEKSKPILVLEAERGSIPVESTNPYADALSQHAGTNTVIASKKGIKKLVGLTAERIYFIHKRMGLGFLGMDVESYSLLRISSIELQPGILSSTLEIKFDQAGNGFSELVRFAAGEYQEWNAFANQIRGKMFALRNPAPQNNNTSSSPVRSPMEILQERFARGEISDEEYQRRLRVLKQ